MGKINGSIESFEKSIERFVAERIGTYEPIAPKRFKAIHDSVWGTNVFNPAEIAIIDSPLIQRLRYIHQTGCAYYTFPSANHTRFEHSLGTAVIATKMVDSLNTKKPGTFDLIDRQKIRFAALLHDCGHGIFSHISEEIYGGDEEINNMIKTDYPGTKPHELISYYIVRSKKFGDLFNSIKKIYAESKSKYDSIFSIKNTDIADLIIGRGTNEKPYLGKVINGPFDADKIDYIFRDSYFTGIPLTIDLERLLYVMQISCIKIKDKKAKGKEEEQIVMSQSGVSVIEQMLMNKLQLYSSFYHHPKVRAADAMIRCFAHYIERHPCKQTTSQKKTEDSKGESEFHINLQQPSDYLEYGDFDFLNINLHKDDYLKNIITKFRNRNLPMKSLVIGYQTVKKSKKGLAKLQMERKNETFWKNRQKIIENDIFMKAKRSKNPPNDVYDVIVDVPKHPKLNEAELIYIILSPDDKKPKLASDFTPLTSKWLTTFKAHKWYSYVFCMGNDEQRESVRLAAIDYFKEEYGIEFKDLATKLAHI